jgi:hypothetical protein
MFTFYKLSVNRLHPLYNIYVTRHRPLLLTHEAVKHVAVNTAKYGSD